MESLQEAYLMIGLDGDNLSETDRNAIKSRKWMLAGLVVHAYNLKNGLICTGFDEDDPELPEDQKDTGILNLPSNFNSISSEIMTFRYKHKTCKPEEDLILKIIEDESNLEINGMSSLSADEIFSCQLQIVDELYNQAKFDNIDAWATTKFIKDEYVQNVFNKLTKQQEPKKEETKTAVVQEPSPLLMPNQPYRPQQPMPMGGFPPGHGGGNPLMVPQPGTFPGIIGDPVDPLRIGGPRGGFPGSHVGPNSGMFGPGGHLMGGRPGQGIDPSLGGQPDFFGQMGGPHDLHPQFPNPRRGGPGGFGGGPGFGGGMGGGFPGGGFGGGPPGGFM